MIFDNNNNSSNSFIIIIVIKNYKEVAEDPLKEFGDITRSST